MDAQSLENAAPCIGITGGIGTGKSTVAAAFARRGAAIIEADRIGYDVLRENTEVHRLLADVFGSNVLEPDGLPNREVIGDRVFGNPKALANLNNIVHPPLLKRLRRSLDSIRTDESTKLVAVDAALITEWGIATWFDRLILVIAPVNAVRERLIAKGLTHEQIERRIASQLPEEARLEEADVVIRNDGNLAELDVAIENVWRKLVKE